MNDGNDLTSSHRGNGLIAPAYTGTIFHTGWSTDLGTDYEIACMDYKDTPGLHAPTNLEYATSAGGPGSYAFATFTTYPNTPTYGWRRLIFDTSITARYLRFTDDIFTPGTLPYGFSYYEALTGWTWKLNGQ